MRVSNDKIRCHISWCWSLIIFHVYLVCFNSKYLVLTCRSKNWSLLLFFDRQKTSARLSRKFVRSSGLSYSLDRKFIFNIYFLKWKIMRPLYRPVMHNFFLERFLQPADWFEKRLAYTRSVAASSMVSFLCHIGDVKLGLLMLLEEVLVLSYSFGM